MQIRVNNDLVMGSTGYEEMDEEEAGAEYDFGFLCLEYPEDQSNDLLKCRALEKGQNGSGMGDEEFGFGHVKTDYLCAICKKSSGQLAIQSESHKLGQAGLERELVSH